MKKRLYLYMTLLMFAAVGCKTGLVINPDDIPGDEESPTSYSGGEATVFGYTSNVFFTPSPKLSGHRLIFHLQGDEQFERKFVAYPAPHNQGLGPLYVNVSCRSCHGRDGRGRPAIGGELEGPTEMLFRLSIPGTDAQGGPKPVPGFGDQLQNLATLGLQPEGKLSVTYIEEPGTFPDGETYSLRRPIYRILAPYRPLPSDLMISARIPSPVTGLGLLEAVTEQTILSFADPNDVNGDGISGKPNYVYDVARGRTSIGRFGWKANQPSLYQQTAAAYSGDMGVTTPLFSVESCHGQPQCDDLVQTRQEVDNYQLLANAHYVRTLGVPARRKVFDPTNRRGEQLFIQANCSGCHIPSMRTGNLEEATEVSDQTIRPYTDMLLHDMGINLADNRPDFLATGREWRTAPLWGIGLTQVVSGFTVFLHDGRARNLIEAILWHGGEAQQSVDSFKKMPKADRDALIAFLNSL